MLDLPARESEHSPSKESQLPVAPLISLCVGLRVMERMSVRLDVYPSGWVGKICDRNEPAVGPDFVVDLGDRQPEPVEERQHLVLGLAPYLFMASVSALDEDACTCDSVPPLDGDLFDIGAQGIERRHSSTQSVVERYTRSPHPHGGGQSDDSHLNRGTGNTLDKQGMQFEGRP